MLIYTNLFAKTWCIVYKIFLPVINFNVSEKKFQKLFFVSQDLNFYFVRNTANIIILELITKLIFPN